MKITIKSFFPMSIIKVNAGMRHHFKDEAVETCRSPNIRSGRFLWMDEHSKRQYLAVLNKKIIEGYFTSERILSKIVEEIAPVFSEHLDNDVSGGGGRGSPLCQ
jgi:hypothetical protein